LLFLLLLITFSIPSVQTYFGEYATNRINDKFGSNININKASIQFNGDIELKNILIKDHKNDSLIAIDELNSSIISFMKINNNKLIFSDIDIYGLYFNIKTYQGEIKNNLDVFVDRFKKRKKKSTNIFQFKSNSLSIYKSRFILDNENKSKHTVLDFKNLNIEADNFIINGPDVGADIDKISFNDQSGIKLKDLKTKFQYTASSMTLKDLNLKTYGSEILGDLIFSYNKGDFRSFNDNVIIKSIFKKSKISLEELNMFYPQFGGANNIIFDAKTTGTLNDFDLIDLSLQSNGGTVIIGDFHFDNLIDSKDREFVMASNIKKLSSNYKDLKGILPVILGEKLPSSLISLGLFSAKGDVEINKQKVSVDFDINTELGQIKADLILNDIIFIDSASYLGQLELINFRLGKLIENEIVGIVETKLNIKGKGFKLKNLNSKIQGKFKLLEFNQYKYNDIDVLGVVENRVFNGQLKANDNNLKLDFSGLVDFSGKKNIYDFTTNINQANLNALNFYTKDDKSSLSGIIEMDMQGKNINDLFGQIKFKKLKYINDDDDYFFDDFLIVSKFDSLGIRNIEFDSPEILQGNFSGYFKLEEIPTLLRNTLVNVYSESNPVKITENQVLNFNFKVYNKIIEVFYPDLKFGSNSFFKGVLESDPKKSILTFKSPEIKNESFFAKNVKIKLDNDNPIFNSFVEIDSLSTQYFKANDFSLISSNINDTLYVKSNFNSGKNKSDEFDFNLSYINRDNIHAIDFKPSTIQYKNVIWELRTKYNSKNTFVYDSNTKGFKLEPINMTNSLEKIIFNANALDSLSTTIDVKFEDVDLSKVTPDIDSLKLGGIVNGKLELLKSNGTYLPKSLLSINSFNVNGFNLGEFEADISGNSSLTNYDVDVKIQNDLSESFSAVGNLDVSGDKSFLNLDLSFNEFILNPLNPFGGGAVSNIRGNVSGKSKITGRLERPMINGLLILDDGGFSIPYLNIDYEFNNSTRIILADQSFIFDSANFIDTKFNSKAQLNGKMSHVNFTNWSLDTKIQTDRLLVLDTEQREESLYYGTSYVTGNIDVSGPMNQLFVEANVSTSEGTIFKIPLSDSEMISENSYIKFVSRDEKSNKSIRNVKLDEIKGIEMEFNMDVTDDAEIEIVIDPDSGSSIIGRGNGSILAQINTNDKFQMYGDFLVLDGYYNYSLGKLIQKKFKLVKDGSLQWDGNPLKAEINIEAIYDGISVNPSTLLDNPINQSIPVEVKVNLTGALEKPDLDFDISFPKINSTLNNELRDRLRDKDKRQFQALSLLATGSFRSKIALDSQDAFELVSDGVTNVLNDIFSNDDNKVKLGLDLDIGENTPEYETDSRVGFTLSTKISENILINGKVGVPVGGVSQSTVAGDFEVELLLNEDRTLSLKFFNRENSIQNFGEQIGYTQGLGLSYNIEFDNLKELLKELFSKNQKEQIKISEEKNEKSSVPDYIEFK